MRRATPNAVAQFASIAALEGGEDGQELMDAMVREFDARRKFIVHAIRSVDGLDCPTPKGAFYVMMDVRALLGRRYRGQRIEGSMDLCGDAPGRAEGRRGAGRAVWRGGLLPPLLRDEPVQHRARHLAHRGVTRMLMD